MTMKSELAAMEYLAKVKPKRYTLKRNMDNGTMSSVALVMKMHFSHYCRFECIHVVNMRKAK